MYLEVNYHVQVQDITNKTDIKNSAARFNVTGSTSGFSKGS